MTTLEEVSRHLYSLAARHAFLLTQGQLAEAAEVERQIDRVASLQCYLVDILMDFTSIYPRGC